MSCAKTHKFGFPTSILWIVALGFILISPPSARAVNITETLEPEQLYFEFSVGFYGLTPGDFGRLWQSSSTLSYGLIPRLSAYIGLSAQANQSFTKGVGSLGFGLFGTPIKSRHFSMHMWLHAGIGRSEGVPLITSIALSLQNDFVLSPGVELNLDVYPGGHRLGLYVVALEEFRGFEVKSVDGKTLASAFAPTTTLQVGTYFDIVPNVHRLILRYDMAFRHYNHARPIAIGGIALGYNITFGKGFTLTTELYFDIPQPGESFTMATLIGIGK